MAMRISTVKLLVMAVAAAMLLPRIASAQLSESDLERMRADKRVALVIGNGNYRNFQQLDNPVNDTTGVARRRALGGGRNAKIKIIEN
jgi:hypothetical protein